MAGWSYTPLGGGRLRSPKYNLVLAVAILSTVAPDRIYIHTDATPDAWHNAKDAGDLWTRRVLAVPGVTPNFVVAPAATKHGVAIERIEHKSDIIRIEALRQFGGLYLDFDAIPL